MQVTILDGPEDEPRKCFFCRDIDPSEKIHITAWKHLGKVEYAVETLWRYCPRCGREIMSEKEYRKLWYETYNDSRLFEIDGNIATDELILAMNNAKNKYQEENNYGI